MKLRGKVLLQVSSVFLIIGAVLSCLMGTLGIATGGMAIQMSGQQDVTTPETATGLGILVIISCAFMIILAIIQLMAGICGIKNCNKAEMAGKCMKYGVFLLIVTAVNLVMQMVGGQFRLASLISFLLPVLYMWGASRNRA